MDRSGVGSGQEVTNSCGRRLSLAASLAAAPQAQRKIYDPSSGTGHDKRMGIQKSGTVSLTSA